MPRIAASSVPQEPAGGRRWGLGKWYTFPRGRGELRRQSTESGEMRTGRSRKEGSKGCLYRAGVGERKKGLQGGLSGVFCTQIHTFFGYSSQDECGLQEAAVLCIRCITNAPGLRPYYGYQTSREMQADIGSQSHAKSGRPAASGGSGRKKGASAAMAQYALGSFTSSDVFVDTDHDIWSLCDWLLGASFCGAPGAPASSWRPPRPLRVPKT
jgi:hypothetical protein